VTVADLATATPAEVAAATGLPDGLADGVAAASLVLARRLHAGGTLWCASPAWPHHAQHVAVEFVHPVIVGKPALPAVALSSHELTATARANARPAMSWWRSARPRTRACATWSAGQPRGA